MKLETLDRRAPDTVKRLEYLLLTGQLEALCDTYNDEVDFESKYGPID